MEKPPPGSEKSSGKNPTKDSVCKKFGPRAPRLCDNNIFQKEIEGSFPVGNRAIRQLAKLNGPNMNEHDYREKRSLKHSQSFVF